MPLVKDGEEETTKVVVVFLDVDLREFNYAQKLLICLIYTKKKKKAAYFSITRHLPDVKTINIYIYSFFLSN